jgi:hypothetical protein
MDGKFKATLGYIMSPYLKKQRILNLVEKKGVESSRFEKDI